MDDRGHHLPFLEWMITTSCDLACPGCDRFIDYDHNWTQEYTDIEQGMSGWSKRLDPDNVTLIGGEPLIHPKIYDIVRLTRSYFDHSRIEIYTNGLLLEKRKDILQVLIDNAPSKLSVTIHNRNRKVRTKIEHNVDTYIFQDLPWQQLGPLNFVLDGVELEITDPTAQGGWYDYRRKIDGSLKPYNDNDILNSYMKCTANIYPIIYKNQLYKCPPISMLRTHLKKYNQLNDTDWMPYLDYQGLNCDCNDNELEKFVHNIFQPHKICGMCPANPELKLQEEAVVKGRI